MIPPTCLFIQFQSLHQMNLISNVPADYMKCLKCPIMCAFLERNHQKLKK